MNQRMESHFFWGAYSPLSAVSGCALIILASSRLAFAVFCAGAVLWIYSLSALVYFFPAEYVPARGKPLIHIFFSGLMTSFYLFLAGFINPLIVLGCWFFVILVPVSLIASGLLSDLEDVDPSEALFRIALEALSLGFLIIALSLIREPLGFGSLSLPGGRGGIFEIFSSSGESFFPIRIISVSAGGFLLLGYAIAMYRYFQEANRLGDSQW